MGLFDSRLILPLAVLLGTAPLLAQRTPKPAIVVAGTVRDSLTGAPVSRGYVSVADSYGATLQRDGSFRLEGLAPGVLRLIVVCATERLLHPATAFSGSVTIPADSLVHLVLRADARDCDPRPHVEITGTFAGHYSLGFEDSTFRPCGVGPSAWLGFLPSDFRWPEVRREETGGFVYFVRWRGTLRGPGEYGHLNGSPYEIRVAEVLEIRAPRANDCRP